MAWNARTVVTQGNSSGGNLTFSPSGFAAGDFCVLVLYSEYGATAWTLPSGWSWINQGVKVRANNGWVSMAWKWRAAGDSSYTVTHGGTAWRTGALMGWSGGAGSGDQQDTTYTSRASVTNEWDPIANGLTTVTDGCLLIIGSGNYGGSNLGIGSSGFTLAGQLGGTGIAYKVQTTKGATGNITLDNASNDDKWATLFIAIKPPTGITVTPAAGTVKAVSVGPASVLIDQAITPAARTVKAVSVGPASVLIDQAITPAARSVRAVGIDPAVVIDQALQPAAGSVRAVGVDPQVLGGGTQGPLGDSDSPGFVTFMLSRAIYSVLSAKGAADGLNQPNGDNSGEWDSFLH